MTSLTGGRPRRERGSERRQELVHFQRQGDPGTVDRARVRSTLTYRITPRLQARVEVNPLSTRERVNPLVREFKNARRDRRHEFWLHRNARRAKLLRNLETKRPIAPYFGLAYGTYQDSLRMIGGIYVGFTESLASMVIFDGFNVHPLSTLAAVGTCSRSC